MRDVAVLVAGSVRPIELALFAEVFGVGRAGAPSFAYAVCAESPGVAVPVDGGLSVTPSAGLERIAAADLVAVTASEVSAAGAAALHAAVGRGARVVAVGRSVVALGAAGLVRGRRIAVHRAWVEEVARRFPSAIVDAFMPYVIDGPVSTSAGVAGGIDLCLRLVRLDHGTVAAETIARALAHGVVRRDDGLGDLLGWALGNLHEELSLDVLARRALLSRRAFVRRFRAATGTSPYAWVLEQRLRSAQRMLAEEPWVGVEDAAVRAGFSSGALLRRHFRRRFGCTPSQYRTRFASRG